MILCALSAACSTERPAPVEPPRASAPSAVSTSALVGADGDVTITGEEVLNEYTALDADAAAGASSIQVFDVNELTSDRFGSLAAGDLLMVIQMQGATITFADDNATYGTPTVNGAGLYELVTVDAVNGNTISLRTKGNSGLRNSYSMAGRTQVVRVPQLASLTIGAMGIVKASPWNGTSGGVVALQVQNALTVNGTLQADAAGFRGGEIEEASTVDIIAYRSTDSSHGAEKGESIAGYGPDYDALGGRYARGAPANGGGGGNAHNAGGGGGANGRNGKAWSGAGVMRDNIPGAEAWALDPDYIANGGLTDSSGGGRGGYTYSSIDQDPRVTGPSSPAWGGDDRDPVGGLGGRPVSNDPATRLFLGGGGGAGDGNNEVAGRGGNGGGLVWVVADTVTGAGTISANGEAGANTKAEPHTDAPGGGGAGGTVVVAARALSGVSLAAKGGAGGQQLIEVAEAEGPGGGGGGGYIAIAGGTVPRDVSGGTEGITRSTSMVEFPNNGATAGAEGELGPTVTNLPLYLPSDLTITKTDNATTVAPGETVTYTITVTNNGPNAVGGATVTDTFPAALTNVSWTCAPAAACSVTSGTGNIDVRLSLPSGETATFTATATVAPGASGTLSNTATVTSSFSNEDPAPGNNTSTDTTTITTGADLAVTLTDSPDPVATGGTFTYTMGVNNQGPSAATSVTATLNLPAGTTFVNATGTGWTCSESGGVVTCTRPTAATGALPDITVQVTAPSAAGTVTATASVSATTQDPVTDNNSATQSTTVVLPNQAPDAVNDTFPVAVNSGPTTLPVLNNDTDPDGDTLTVTAVTQPAVGGTVTLVGGVVSFTPTPGFSGPVTFTYTISDGNGGTDTATVTVNVGGTNSQPTANDDTLEVNEDSGATTVPVLANDTDPDNDPLTVTEVTQPAVGGTVTLVGGVVSFTPAPDFSGTTSFTYTISDGKGGTDTATVNVTVNPVNDAPNAVDDTLTVDEDSGATTVPVLANDTDPEGNPLTVTAVTQPAVGGTVTLVGGVVSFTPAPDFSGTTSFTYTISDGNGGTDTATVTVTVNPVNDAPNAVDDSYSVAVNSGATTLPVLNNDTDVDGDTLTVTAVTQPAVGGTVTLVGGVVSFTPTPGFSGPVTFTYTVSDGNGGTDIATVTVNVEGTNSQPMANNDTLEVDEDSGATVVDVLANDTDPDTNDTLTVTEVTQPAHGTVTLVNGVVTYQPAPNYNGPDSFTYTISDGKGGTATATVNVTVRPVNDPPNGVDDTFTVTPNSGPTTLPVLTNDTDVDGDELTVTEVTQPPAGGTVTVSPDGKGVVFTPSPDFIGQVTFTYTVSDGKGGTDTVTVTVNVGTPGGDSDEDGIPDEEEERIGTDPFDADTDDDGLLDGEDGTEDTDGDGVINARDPDSDNDGVLDGTEAGVTPDKAHPDTDTTSQNYKADEDPTTTTNPRDADTDDDGLTDGAEDTDKNGSVGSTETDPNNPDTDGGGELDGAEVAAGTDPLAYGDDLVVVGRGCASTGAGSLAPLALLLALPMMLRRRRSLQAGAWGLLGLLGAVLVAAPAHAQSQGIDVQQYKPGPGSRDVLGLHSAQLAPHLGWNLGLSFNYARDPLNFLRPASDEFVYKIVENQFTFDLMGAVSLFDRLEVGVALPITSQGAGPGTGPRVLAGGVDATGLGDLRVVPKLRVLSTDGGLHLGLAVPVLLPTSGGKEYLGRSGVAAFPRLLGEWTSDEGTRVLANVGVNLQPQEQLYNLNVSNEFAYGLGAELPFKLGDHRLAAEATLTGAVGLKETHVEERPLELLAALKYLISDGLAAHVGAGPGITRGYGTPGFRVFAGVNWTAPQRAEPVREEPPAPVCPQGPEDLDGFEDEDGCADPDNDGDGILDGNDRCPNEPETKNGHEDEDGCPDELPPPPPVDTDGDGLTDDKDRCPQAAEDKDGFQDADGCPDPDNDRDGVVDAEDKCPLEPETINGVADEDGCPDKGKVKVLVEGERIVILDKVHFATNKDVILARSYPLLKQVGQVLRANPHLTKVRVEGHTDSQGSDSFNLDLSQRRANNVRKRLIEEERIAPERLEAVGYGETKPADTNSTARGRENNRRVVFTILEQKPIEVEKEVP